MFNDRLVVDPLDKSRNDVNEYVGITKINCEKYLINMKYTHLTKYSNIIIQYLIQESFTNSERISTRIYPFY